LNVIVMLCVSRSILPLAVLLGAPLFGQWLKYPTPGVPRTPSGTPNLGAPAPTTADGKPDLSGIWEANNRRYLRPCPLPEGCGDLAVDDLVVDIGSHIGGLPYQPWAVALVKERSANHAKDDPESRCQSNGPVRALTSPLMRKIVQTPGLILVLNENGVKYRQIFTDGRSLPEDPNPDFNGYSVGHWDGDTLVVETNGLQDGVWLDRKGSPLTEAALLTERYHRVNYGNMEIEVTVNDPKAYTKPWTIQVHHFAVIDTDLLDDFCVESERSAEHLQAK
jgi:hypothetical protein